MVLAQLDDNAQQQRLAIKGYVLDIASGIRVVNRVQVCLTLYPWVFDARDFYEAARALANGTHKARKQRVEASLYDKGETPHRPSLPSSEVAD